MTATILVAGFGNRLAGDDGVGPAVVDRLQAAGLGRRTRAVEVGGDALHLPQLWSGETEIWLVDAVIRGAAPGTVHRFDHDQILAVPQRHGTVHHLSLPESLRWIELAYPQMRDVRYRLWGVEPASVGLEPGLDDRVRLAADAVATEIRAAVRDLFCD